MTEHDKALISIGDNDNPMKDVIEEVKDENEASLIESQRPVTSPVVAGKLENTLA